MEQGKGVIMGLWKFAERVGNKDLLEVAEEWAKDSAYTQLYIRKASKDQYAIGFVHESDGSQEAHRDYFDKTSDTLKRKFGNDLVGWDISTTNQLIKGF